MPDSDSAQVKEQLETSEQTRQVVEEASTGTSSTSTKPRASLRREIKPLKSKRYLSCKRKQRETRIEDQEEGQR